MGELEGTGQSGHLHAVVSATFHVTARRTRDVEAGQPNNQLRLLLLNIPVEQAALVAMLDVA